MKLLALSCLLLTSLLPMAAEVKLGEELVSRDVHVIVKKTTMVTWDMFNLTPKGILIQVWSANSEAVGTVSGYMITVNYLDNNGKARRLVDFAAIDPAYNFGLVLIPVDLSTVVSISSVEAVEIKSPVKIVVFE